MNPWFAKTSILLGSVILAAIRATYRFKSRNVNVEENRMGRLEVALLALASIGFIVPLLWVVSSAFAVANYSLRLVPFIVGVLISCTWSFILRPVARGPWYKLVGHAQGKREARTGHSRYLPPCPTPDVLGVSGIFTGPGICSPELGSWSILRHCNGSTRRSAGERRRAAAVGAFRQRLRSVHGSD